MQFSYDFGDITSSMRKLGFSNESQRGVVEQIGREPCPFCLETMRIPVILVQKCADCSAVSTRACMDCLREYLMLKKPVEERRDVKHLYCRAMHRTSEMSSKVYQVDMGFMEEADRLGVKPPNCQKCGVSFTTHVEGYAHTSPSWKVYLGHPNVETCAMLGQ